MQRGDSDLCKYFLNFMRHKALWYSTFIETSYYTCKNIFIVVKYFISESLYTVTKQAKFQIL